jgi:uridine kinase
VIEKIVKRDGRLVPFRRAKITHAVLSAAVAVGGHDREAAERVTDDVIARLEAREFASTYPTVEEVQDLVEKCLIERGHARTAKAYIIYRYEHSLKRESRDSLTYSSDNIPYRKLWQALSWSVDNECTTVDQISSWIESGRFGDLVSVCEAFYASELDDAAARILGRIGDVKIIIVSGPSSSGKTTTTIKIDERLRQQGYSLVTLNVDNYYFDLADQPKDAFGDYDYETPQAIDLALIARHLEELLAGKSIDVPFYNFKTGRREGISGRMSIEEKDIILIDSLHGMFEEMTAGVGESRKFKLYIETLSQIKDSAGRFIRWTDIRLLRRMIRDMQFRNYNPRQTLLHWHYVRRSELRYITPRFREADVIVNSALPYELPIMKHRMGGAFDGFIAELEGDAEREDAFERALRVRTLFGEMAGWQDESVVPEASLLREFIGGSSYSY